MHHPLWKEQHKRGARENNHWNVEARGSAYYWDKMRRLYIRSGENLFWQCGLRFDPWIARAFPSAQKARWEARLLLIFWANSPFLFPIKATKQGGRRYSLKSEKKKEEGRTALPNSKWNMKVKRRVFCLSLGWKEMLTARSNPPMQ